MITDDVFFVRIDKTTSPSDGQRFAEPKRSREVLEKRPGQRVGEAAFLVFCWRGRCLRLAPFGHGAMSDLSPLCAPKRTFANASASMG